MRPFGGITTSKLNLHQLLIQITVRRVHMFKNNILSKFVPLFIIIIICIPVVIPYFHSGYFPTHDGEWAVVRLGDMFRTLRDLQFPPRYSGALNFGYGYPLFNFTYPFPYYLGILFYIPTHSFILSIKTMFVVSVFLSGIFMYFASNELWKNRTSGVISAILYIYLPYRMVDLYVRGSIGESLSFSLFPLILYLGLKLFNSPFARHIVFFLSISIAVLVMTHNIMTVLFLPVLLIFMLIRIISEKRYDVLQSLMLCLVLGFGVSAFFWLPALFEKSNILLSKIPIADRSLYFVNLRQLLIPSWGYGVPTENGGFSYQLGIIQSITVCLTILVIGVRLFKNKLIQPTAVKYTGILLVIYLLCFTMLFSFTLTLWKITPLLKEINYPWTLLSQLGFVTAILGGFLSLQGKYIKYLLIVFAFLSIILVFPYAKPEKFIQHDDSYYLTNEATTTSSSELMPLWVKEFPKEHYKDKVEIVSGSAEIKNLVFNSKKLEFDYTATSDTVFRINTIYYPGWKVYLNNELVKENHLNPQGVIEVLASKYGSHVSLYFGETVARTAANCLSIIALLVLFFILMRPLLIFK